MTRPSVAAFLAAVREISPAEAASRDRRLAEQARATGVRAGCSARGAALLLGIARVDAAIDGFPERVSLASPDGRDAGLEAVRSGDGWRFGGTVDALLHLKHDMPPHRMASARAFALAAMGAPTVPAAEALLASLTGWEELDAALDASLARLPVHVVRSVAAHAGRAARDVGLPTERHRDLVAAAWRRCPLFPRQPGEAFDGVRDPLSRAAENFRADVVASLLDPVLAPPGATMPDPEVEGRRAMLLAVRGTWLDAGETVRVLAGAGVGLGPDADGRTALHALAEAADPGYARQHAPLAVLLAELGADREAADSDGRTAADLYAGRAGPDEMTEALAPRAPAPGAR